ncbi:MAG: hypothetical protein ACK5LM_02550 [Lactovum sp.]
MIRALGIILLIFDTGSYREIISVGKIILQTALLYILSLLLLTVFNLVFPVTKSKISSILISVLVIERIALSTEMIASLASLFHLFPSIYLKVAAVVNNNLAYQNQNPQITFEIG